MVSVVDMTMYDGHHDYMKVNVAELKTHLSKYVKAVREGGDMIEVCVRDRPVAYLTGLDSRTEPPSPEIYEVSKQLAARGLRLESLGKTPEAILQPGEATDGRDVVNSVLEMRGEEDW